MSVLIMYAIPIFIVSMIVEGIWSRRTAKQIRGYTGRDTAASLAMGLGNVAISAVTKLAAIAALVFLYEHRLFDLGTGWPVWVALFFAEDFCYYWFHRTSHEVRLFWAAHVNHHSSTHYNLSTALRQSWTTPLTSPIFWMPLALVGFAPWMILTQQAISLLYQFILHTEAVDRLPRPIEWFFNTPSHHRVHHGRNVEYLDKNHGGILIIWDRLFGTFEPERAPVDYGLTSNLATYNPVRIAFHEWGAMLDAARHAATPGDAVRHLFAPPGWSPDGSTLTSKQQQARLPQT